MCDGSLVLVCEVGTLAENGKKGAKNSSSLVVVVESSEGSVAKGWVSFERRECTTRAERESVARSARSDAGSRLTQLGVAEMDPKCDFTEMLTGRMCLGGLNNGCVWSNVDSRQMDRIEALS